MCPQRLWLGYKEQVLEQEHDILTGVLLQLTVGLRTETTL